MPVQNRRARLRVRWSQALLLCALLTLVVIYLISGSAVAGVLMPMNVLALYFNAPIVPDPNEGGSWP